MYAREKEKERQCEKREASACTGIMATSNAKNGWHKNLK